MEREVTVRCPSDCEYLRAARKHESVAQLDFEQLPHRDLGINDEFLNDHAAIIVWLGAALAKAALRSDAVDSDAQEALAGLVQSYRTLQSGVIYEAVPQNPIAAGLYVAVKDAAAEFQDEETERLGVRRTRDADVLRALAFLHVLSIARANGRRYGRAFLDGSAGFQDDEGAGGGPRIEPGSPLILP